MSTILKFQDWDIDGANNWRQYFDNSGTSDVVEVTDFNEVYQLCGNVLGYDKNGNLHDWTGRFELKWDAFGRLREVWDGTP